MGFRRVNYQYLRTAHPSRQDVESTHELEIILNHSSTCVNRTELVTSKDAHEFIYVTYLCPRIYGSLRFCALLASAAERWVASSLFPPSPGIIRTLPSMHLAWHCSGALPSGRQPDAKAQELGVEVP
jgi:hypothetical protein